MPLTIVGLGPGSADLLTQEAVRVLDEADLILFRTRIHPTIDELDLTAETRDFDALYDSAPSFDDVYETIVQEIMKLSKDPRKVVYAGSRPPPRRRGHST